MSPVSDSSQLYLQPVEDGLPLRKSGPWVEEKLHYVERYLQRFIIAMRDKPFRAIRYIDLFAGPGKCLIEESGEIRLGSALLALQLPHLFSEYVFVDANADNIHALRTRCASLAGQTTLGFQVGDSNELVTGIVARINQEDAMFVQGKWSSLNLCFLDPEGLELEWATVASLASVAKMDLIIHYSQSGLTRNMEQMASRDEETRIDRFFGDSEWRRIYSSGRQKGQGNNRIHRDLIDYYRAKLQGLGYVEIRDETAFSDSEPLIRNRTRNTPLYRLLFASKSDLGTKFWSAVTRTGSSGQQRLF
jgi:three-Cys-motif partner protein